MSEIKKDSSKELEKKNTNRVASADSIRVAEWIAKIITREEMGF